jgi:hypothetical protein
VQIGITRAVASVNRSALAEARAAAALAFMTWRRLQEALLMPERGEAQCASRPKPERKNPSRLVNQGRVSFLEARAGFEPACKDLQI